MPERDPWERKLVRDPVHGFIGLSNRELKLAETPAFLRLGRIHQLAHAFVVYPGAVHTRLEHSFGTLYVAGRIANQIDLDDHEKEVVRSAALLHDLGHGPYSHLFEGVMRSIGRPKFKHEDVTRMFVENDPEISAALQGIGPDVDRVLSGGAGLLSRIISGGLDADKLDYLRRDAYHAGVSYGNFDIERILRSVCRVTSAKEDYLAVAWKGKDALENYRLARYSMHAQVYEHKTRLVADDIFVRAICLALESDVLPRDDLLSDDPVRFLAAYASLDDAYVDLKVLGECTGPAAQLMGDLLNRRLLKRAYELPLTPQAVNDTLKREALKKMEQAEFDDIERDLAAGANCPAERVIVHPQTISIKLYERFNEDGGEDATSLLIRRQDGSVTSMADESPIRALPEPIRRIYVFCPNGHRTRVNQLATERFEFPGVYKPPEGT